MTRVYERVAHDDSELIDGRGRFCGVVWQREDQRMAWAEDRAGRTTEHPTMADAIRWLRARP